MVEGKGKRPAVEAAPGSHQKKRVTCAKKSYIAGRDGTAGVRKG